jgi:hypothetical protein
MHPCLHHSRCVICATSPITFMCTGAYNPRLTSNVGSCLTQDVTLVIKCAPVFVLTLDALQAPHLIVCNVRQCLWTRNDVQHHCSHHSSHLSDMSFLIPITTAISMPSTGLYIIVISSLMLAVRRSSNAFCILFNAVRILFATVCDSFHNTHSSLHPILLLANIYHPIFFRQSLTTPIRNVYITTSVAVYPHVEGCRISVV